MTLLDTVMFYTVYRPALAKLVCAMPLPKDLKSRFVLWQARGLIVLAMKKLTEEITQRAGSMDA